MQSHHCRAKLAAVTIERSHDLAHRVLQWSEIQRDASTRVYDTGIVRQLDVETPSIASEPVRMFLHGVVNDDAAAAAERGNHIAHLDVRAAQDQRDERRAVPVVLHRAAPAVIGFKNGAGFGYPLHRSNTVRAPGGTNPSALLLSLPRSGIIGA